MRPIYLMLTATLTALSMTSPLLSKAEEIPMDHAQTTKPATIKILLQERKDSLLLEVTGAYKIFCPHTNVLLSSGTSAKRDLIRPGEDGISWKDLFPGIYAIRIVPANSQTTFLVNGIQYKGCLELYDLGGSLRALNEVDVESYLKSSLATKFGDVTEKEVLNSLAIVARTDAYYRIQKEALSPWHVTADETGYAGFAVTLQNLPLEQAIGETRHAILTYQNKPFAACWTENSAGKTASFSSVFRKNTPSPKGVIIPGMESERQRSGWSFQVDKEELAKIVHLAAVSSMSVFSEKESGKVYAIKVGNDDKAKTLDFFTLQNALGKSKLKSNDFTIEIFDNSVKFKGYGQGNGVGLCLYSATLMAKQGLDAKRILSEFFADTTLEKLRTLPSAEKQSL